VTFPPEILKRHPPGTLEDNTGLPEEPGEPNFHEAATLPTMDEIIGTNDKYEEDAV